MALGGYALHVGFVPLMVVGLLSLHLLQVYRHNVSDTGSVDLSRARPYWPYQTVRNVTVLTTVLNGIALAAIGWGAPLDAPADPDLTFVPRPEWYFRCLFELRRYFTGEWEFVATLVIPLAILLFFVSLPLVEWLLPRRMSWALERSLSWLRLAAGGCIRPLI